MALQARELTVIFIRKTFSTDESFVRQIPKTVHGITLVSGGVCFLTIFEIRFLIDFFQVLAGLAYEFTGRPWDHARRIVHIHKLQTPPDTRVPWLEIMHKEGFVAFFKSPALPHAVNPDSSMGCRPRLTIALRTLGRVGPWGIGFLAWEAFGPGLPNN